MKIKILRNALKFWATRLITIFWAYDKLYMKIIENYL